MPEEKSLEEVLGNIAREIIEQEEAGPKKRIRTSTKIKGLMIAFEELQKAYTFKPGDFVTWKPGLKNKRSGGPFMIIEVLDEPIINTGPGAESSYYRERLDVIAAHIDEDGDFLAFHYDSSRFQPFDISTVEGIEEE